jgi:DNA helicase MCM9
VCKLNTRCSILAATNPKGQYDPEESVSVNVAIASPLLSRFDVVLVLLDTANEEWDKVVSSFVLAGSQTGSEFPTGSGSESEKGSDLGSQTESVPNSQSGSGSGLHTGSGSTGSMSRLVDHSQPSILWNMDKLRNYISYVRRLTPVMTSQANRVLSQYYQVQRQADARNVARTTVRLLESLVRLSQAHARLMCRDKVLVQDAVVAVTIMESSMMGTALLGPVNTLHSAFPQHADEEYVRQETLILDRLGISGADL